MAESNSSLGKALQRGLGVGLMVFLLPLVGGIILVWAVLPKVYAATATIEVNATPAATSSTREQKPLSPDLFVQRMESPDILKMIVENSNLKQILGEHSTRKEPLSSEEALDFLKKNLKTTNNPGTDVFVITVTSESAEAAANIANEVAAFFQSAGDAAESLQEHQRERDDLQAKIDQQQAGIRGELAKRNDLIQALAKKGISIPSDDDVLNQLASGLNAKEDPQLQEYKRNEHELIVRQSILQSYMAQAEMLSYAGISKKGPVQIINQAEVPQHPIRSHLILGALLSAVVGVVLGGIAAVLTTGIRKSLF